MNSFPTQWRFVLIAKGGKAPIGKDWQQKPMTWDAARKLFGKSFQGRQVGAIGVLSGEYSGGLLLLDHDGSSCDALITEWGKLPPTATVTSGKPGHYQLAFWVSQQYWSVIETRKYRTGVIDDQGKHEQVELRWNGCQSLVFGEHPETGNNYVWEGEEIAVAPSFLIEKMLKPENEQVCNVQDVKQQWSHNSAPRSDREWGLSYLNAINPNVLDWYTWRDCLFASHSAGISEPEVRAWSAQASKHTDKGFDSVWHHIKGNKPHLITLGTLGYLAKQNGWEAPSEKHTRSGSPEKAKQPVNIIQIASNALTIEQLQSEIAVLCDQTLNELDLSVKILSLSERSGRNTRDVWELYHSYQRDLVKAEELSNVDELLTLQQKSLKARGIFHPSLATLIERTAIAMPTCEAWLVTTLLPALGSSIGAKSRIVIKASAGYILVLIFWTAIVSKTGRKKSPTQNQIISPLAELEAEAYKVWRENCEQYRKEISAQRRDSESPEPCEPSPRERYLTNSPTPEGLTRILADISPSYSGLLRHTDELLALFQFNQYKSRGDEEQFYLSLFNGGGIISDRVDTEKSVVVERSCVSITGSIQWEVLEKLQAKLGFEDSSGLMARFLFSAEDSPPGYLDLENDDESSVQLSVFLKALYQSLRQLPERDYLLSPEAKKLFQTWQHELTDYSIAETHSGLAAVYPKLETYTGRFALLLHCVNATLQHKHPASTVSEATMLRAITLSKYYLSQAKLIYGTNDPDSLNDKILVKLIDLSKRKGWINSRIAKQNIRSLKSYTPDRIRKLFQDLVEIGHGSVEGQSTQMKWHYSISSTEDKRSQTCEKILVDNLTNVDNLSDFVDTTQSIAETIAKNNVKASKNRPVDRVDTLTGTSNVSLPKPTKRSGSTIGNASSSTVTREKTVIENITDIDLSEWEEVEHD